MLKQSVEGFGLSLFWTALSFVGNHLCVLFAHTWLILPLEGSNSACVGGGRRGKNVAGRYQSTYRISIRMKLGSHSRWTNIFPPLRLMLLVAVVDDAGGCLWWAVLLALNFEGGRGIVEFGLFAQVTLHAAFENQERSEPGKYHKSEERRDANSRREILEIVFSEDFPGSDVAVATGAARFWIARSLVVDVVAALVLSVVERERGVHRESHDVEHGIKERDPRNGRFVERDEDAREEEGEGDVEHCDGRQIRGVEGRREEEADGLKGEECEDDGAVHGGPDLYGSEI